MGRYARTQLGACAVALLVAAPLHAQKDEAVLERGRNLTQAFYDGDLAGIAGQFNVQMRGALGGEEELSGFREQVLAQLGEESGIVEEKVLRAGVHQVYQRLARFAKAPAPMMVVWAFDADDRVAGFSIGPEQTAQREAASRHLDYSTQTPLRLPFDGEWTVVWGGRSVAENYHAAHTDQRFAYDLVVAVDGQRHRGSGAANEDYHCFGRPILAPGAGTVVVATDGIADNTPGRMNSAEPPGNHVVLDHGNGEYSFLAHLREGSVTVSAGDIVAAGDTLGACGNSGNSSEPHLHYHLQNSPDFGRGEGLPAQFLDYTVDGAPVARGEPVTGQRIRPSARR